MRSLPVWRCAASSTRPTNSTTPAARASPRRSPPSPLPSAGLPADPVGLTLLISGVSYTVVEHRPDGTGVSILLLELAA